MSFPNTPDYDGCGPEEQKEDSNKVNDELKHCPYWETDDAGLECPEFINGFCIHRCINKSLEAYDKVKDLLERSLEFIEEEGACELDFCQNERNKDSRCDPCLAGLIRIELKKITVRELL